MKVLRVSAIVFLVGVSLAALTPELWRSTSYKTQFREAPDAAPSSRFPLGTDALGRDRLARLAYGTRVSLFLAPAAAVFSCAAAALLGGLAGWTGGFVEAAIISAADLFLSLPWLFLLLIVRATLPLNVSPVASVTITFSLLGALGWAGPRRGARGSARNEGIGLHVYRPGARMLAVAIVMAAPDSQHQAHSSGAVLDRRPGLHPG